MVVRINDCFQRLISNPAELVTHHRRHFNRLTRIDNNDTVITFNHDRSINTVAVAQVDIVIDLQDCLLHLTTMVNKCRVHMVRLFGIGQSLASGPKHLDALTFPPEQVRLMLFEDSIVVTNVKVNVLVLCS